LHGDYLAAAAGYRENRGIEFTFYVFHGPPAAYRRNIGWRALGRK